MHYTIDYSTLPDGDRQIKARNDVIEYIGKEKYIEVSNIARADFKMTREFFLDTLEILAGISGYPAEVWADDLNLK